ncbi:MAG: SGNH/GDSL hydrolase family protein, partial [Anaerolineae bacterium]|nr:SGNH/GDSL hydrolase family protein [Anaerolineae bacterium]
MPDTHISPTRRRFTRWLKRLAGVGFILLFSWLLLEILLRLMFFSLAPRQQLVLREVRITPFTDSKLLPDPIWQPDREFLTITRPVTNHEQFGSAEVRFTVNTETLWDDPHVAFRTRQELVDRYVDGVAVGDSFTFCFTDEDECWVQRFGALTGRNIINLGITSTGSLSHLRVLEGFGLPLEPPLVIWEWFGNDANEDYGLADLRGETDIKSPNPPIPAPDRNWWDDHSAVYVLLKLYLGGDDKFEASLQFHDPKLAEDGDIRLAFGQPYLWDAFDMSQPHNQYGWERSQQAILDARDRVEAYGGTLL